MQACTHRSPPLTAPHRSRLTGHTAQRRTPTRHSAHPTPLTLTPHRHTAHSPDSASPPRSPHTGHRPQLSRQPSAVPGTQRAHVTRHPGRCAAHYRHLQLGTHLSSIDWGGTRHAHGPCTCHLCRVRNSRLRSVDSCQAIPGPRRTASPSQPHIHGSMVTHAHDARVQAVKRCLRLLEALPRARPISLASCPCSRRGPSCRGQSCR